MVNSVTNDELYPETVNNSIRGSGSNGTVKSLKDYLKFSMAAIHHVLPHLAWQRSNAQAY